MNSYFLSFDMDFLEDTDAEETELWLRKIIPAYYNHTNKQIFFCWNHQQMLDWVDNSKARILINYDEHQDLASEPNDTLSCGTWISYVKWRWEGTYIWRTELHRDLLERGVCDQDLYIVDSKGYSPWKILKSKTNWKTIRIIPRSPKPSLNTILNAEDLAFCLSPNFIYKDMHNMTLSVMKYYRDKGIVVYRKGRNNERYSRKLLTTGRKMIGYNYY